ncbi:MAG: hypothetical protein ACREQA_15380 [Candidatus Binatia bacterium]
MVTTVQIDEETQKRLFNLVAELEAKLSRRVTYDEAIRMLLRGVTSPAEVLEARERFKKLRGSLRGDKEAWRDLRRLRAEEEKRLERLTKGP